MDNNKEWLDQLIEAIVNAADACDRANKMKRERDEWRTLAIGVAHAWNEWVDTPNLMVSDELIESVSAIILRLEDEDDMALRKAGDAVRAKAESPTPKRDAPRPDSG